MKKIIFSFIFCFWAAASNATTMASIQTEIQRWQKSSGSKVQRLNAFYKMHWNYVMTTYPEYATYEGFPGQNDRWTDRSLTAIEDSKKNDRDLLKAIKTVSESGLKGEDLMNYRLFVYSLEKAVESAKFPSEYLAINQMGGSHSSLVNLLSLAPHETSKDQRDLLARLKSFPHLLEQDMLLLKEGLKKNITVPKITLKGLPAQFDPLVKIQMDENPIFEPFKKIQSEEIKQEAKNTIVKIVIPALQKYKDFLIKEYIPNCRENIGWSALPDGINWYNSLIKSHTTLDITAEEIFQIGENEVRRIQKEMAQVRDQLKFKGDAKKFNDSLSESRFNFKTGAAMLERYQSVGKRIDPELPKLFGKLPRLPYGIKEIPVFMAATGPAGYYESGSIEAHRAGYFYVNTFDLSARPTWSVMDLTCHETVPGHHFQISIAKELGALPQFRKNMEATAYTEGWALYAEGLCDELGLYTDPYDKYGYLSAELWRAVRLVVDTGIHAKGWSRDQVTKYMRDAGPFAEQEIQSETDRYIVWPGQALGYKIGELKFKELRQKLKTQLGEKFDVREFHDQALGSGALPLPVLERKMLDWGFSIAKTPSKTKEKVLMK